VSRVPEPQLIETAVPQDPAGVVLLLHGGASRRREMMVSPTQLSVLRMIPIARRVARAGGGELAVYRLLNRVRGWDTHHTPVHDAQWALEEIARRLGGPRPTCLVGHSLGGRAALLAAGAAEVRSAVALAPYVYPSDGDRDLTGRRLLIVHGAQDRIARPENAAAVARGLSRTATVSYVSVERGKHAMLRHHACFDGLAAGFAAATLLGWDRAAADDVLGRVHAGEPWIEW
jgi:dienelactone hydrolase